MTHCCAVAADGSLMQESVLEAQVERLTTGANQAAAQATLTEFYSQWLGLSSLASPENSSGAAFCGVCRWCDSHQGEHDSRNSGHGLLLHLHPAGNV